MRKLALDSSAKWQENKTRGQVGGKERKLDLKIADLFSLICIYYHSMKKLKAYGCEKEIIKCVQMMFA